ncbi:MAG: hypothetical protein JWN17_3049 [Frankiales bacterium]|nr:hypothetical protein [Frankiales bacterium]
MRISFVGYHPPEPDGSAHGRQLWAVGEALRAQGHDVTAWCWRDRPPRPSVADWCTWSPVPGASAVRTRTRALLQPRSDIVRAGWTVPDRGAVVADDAASWPAVRPAGERALTLVQYAVRLDRGALGDWSAAQVQDLRAERRAVRQAPLVWTLSDRVRDAVGRGEVVPAAVPVPAAALPLVDAPVAALLADWAWPPNVRALALLLAGWPDVRDRVPGARLVLAGRGPAPVGTLPGVEWRGEVATTADLLAEAAVFAFPCPATSGTKMKVLDALAHGVPVVTTAAGVEGLHGGGVVVAADRDLPGALAALLTDPQRRAQLAAQGRASVLDHHAPDVAARARLASLDRQLPACR